VEAIIITYLLLKERKSYNITDQKQIYRSAEYYCYYKTREAKTPLE
jgi:hypothetical protein